MRLHRSFGLGMCYVFVIMSLPFLNAGSCEAVGEKAATGGIFLEAESP